MLSILRRTKSETLVSQENGRPIVAWFRRDLRLTDNPAWSWAVKSGHPVVPVFVQDEDANERPDGSASRRWLLGSLKKLNQSLRRQGSRLILRRGAAAPIVTELAQEIGASVVVWNRLYEPAIMGLETEVEARCAEVGIDARSFNAGLLFEPWEIWSGSGTSYRVFTSFWRNCLERGFPDPVPAPPPPRPPAAWPSSQEFEDPGPRCRQPYAAAAIREYWQPGEDGAGTRLDEFLASHIDRYSQDRNEPGKPGTSRLSPHLHFGEIGPRQAAAQVAALATGPGKDAFLRELGWREFSHHLLFHNPELGTANYRREFDRMPWRDAPAELERWQRGRTGYPLVDAGMRQLHATGWMHNRVRMVVASFLTKHLLIDWRLGAKWFWDTLVDADWANNSAGWQWTAGSGADAAPYFRIFNPVAQSRRYDPSGTYLRTWIPELRGLSDKAIHAPWMEKEGTLARAEIRLGESYPTPMVDHTEARERALTAYRTHVRRRTAAGQARR